MNSLKFLTKSGIIILIGLFISKVINYIYRIIIARGFGPETYGTISIGIAIISIFSILSLLGINTAMEYFGGKILIKSLINISNGVNNNRNGKPW